MPAQEETLGQGVEVDVALFNLGHNLTTSVVQLWCKFCTFYFMVLLKHRLVLQSFGSFCEHIVPYIFRIWASVQSLLLSVSFGAGVEGARTHQTVAQ